VLPLLEESLHEGKDTVPAGSLHGEASRRFDLIITDSLRDDPADGKQVLAAWAVLAGGPGCPVIDLSMTAPDPAARIPGWQHGPAVPAGSPATSLTVSAASGMSWGIGHPDREPLALPYDLPGYLCGTEGAVAAILALLHPEGSAVGGHYEVSALDVLASYVGQVCSVFVPFGRAWRRDGARAAESGGFYPGAMFRCRDGHVSIVCRTDREWTGLRHAMGDPPWSTEARFADARVVARCHAEEADQHLSAWALTLTSAEVVALSREHGFAAAPVLTPAQASRLEHFRATGFIEEDSHGVASRPGRPWRVLAAPRAAGEPAGSAGPVAGSRRPAAGPSSHGERPLHGLTVLDLSWVWSGPMLTAQLADLGAEIIKVESRGRPDPTRSRGRSLRDGVPVNGPDLEVSAYFGQMNRGKKSLGVNLATDQGADLVRRLAATVDVVVENMRPGALDRRSLGYADLAGGNPGLVMVSMSMMGHEGPLRELGGYAPVMSGLSGVDALVGYSPDDRVGLFNSSLGDPNGSAHALAALLAALVRRQRTGTGAWIDLSQTACLLATARAALAEELHAGALRVPANSHAVFWPHGTYRCAGDDQWVSLAVRTDRERGRLAALIGASCDSLPDAEKAVADWTSRHDAGHAAALLRDAGLAAARVDGYEQLVVGGWAAEQGLFTQVDHPYLGLQSVFGVPWKRDGQSFPATGPAPLLGQHTDQVLSGRLGLAPEDLTALRVAGVIE
jgi:crotonobetainyl-CoA:carnitine CoA-transferase CaiB-like acyl-CoA transferase